MYDKSDPRAVLAAASGHQPVFTAYSPSEYLRFYEHPPTEAEAGGRTWIMRGQNAVIAYSEAAAGAVFSRDDQPDEWALLLPDAGGSIRLRCGGEEVSVAGRTLTFVPPGASTLTVEAPGRVVRIFTARAADLAGRSLNAAEYATPHHNVPPFVAWPVPADGYRIRTYPIDVPPEPGRFGRIWRCTTLMVNLLDPQVGPRDVTKLSPHHHNDFEQYSLALSGSFIHHLRWAWTPNMQMWRPDEHEFCGTPSVAVIPPPAIHTSRGVDPGVNQLCDIFSPPRLDFSRMNGWVLNAADYPIPD